MCIRDRSDAILIPAVTVLCFVGSYAIHRNLSDVVVMPIFGGLGYLRRKFDPVSYTHLDVYKRQVKLRVPAPELHLDIIGVVFVYVEDHEPAGLEPVSYTHLIGETQPMTMTIANAAC